MANDSASTSTRAPARQSQHASTVRELYEQGGEARDQIVELSAAIRRLLRDSEGVLRERMRKQPYGTIAAAAGVGYVLGGGLSPSAVRLLFAAGGRLAVEAFLHQLTTRKDSAAA
jgi:hypothetical protein